MDTLRRIFESPILTAVKYLFVLMIAVYAYIRVPDPIILAISIIEILLVFFCCNELAWHSRLAASITSSVFLLLASVQLLVLIFANSFATLVMLTNLDSLEDLSGKFLVYGAAALIMLLFICLPQNYIDIPLPETFEHIGGVKSIIFVLCLWEAILVDLNGAAKSPTFAYFDLAFQQAQVVVAENEMKRQPNTTLEFYQAEVKGYRDRPKDLPEKPNIVLIFTEGLSQNIVDDDRKVMPNVAAYQGRSVTFDRYFNHTFATYRGLQGQLFSGYQHNNYDKNTLVSLPQALRQFGYQSAFLNVEGYNREFTTYLNDLGFDEVIDLRDPKQGGPVGDGYSDRLAYEALFDTMEELGKERDPFLLSIYTFGTHATFDSADERFGDGFDTELNKFYDADCQFGTFMKKFEKSALLLLQGRDAGVHRRRGQEHARPHPDDPRFHRRLLRELLPRHVPVRPDIRRPRLRVLLQQRLDVLAHDEGRLHRYRGGPGCRVREEAHVELLRSEAPGAPEARGRRRDARDHTGARTHT